MNKKEFIKLLVSRREFSLKAEAKKIKYWLKKKYKK